MTGAKLDFQPIPQSPYNTELRMARRRWEARRKLRKREHVIAEMSVNFLECKVLSRGHQLFRMSLPEYGTDAIMFHFSGGGGFENGQVQFQVKATDRLRLIEMGRSIRVVVESGNLHHWYWEVDHPFILVVYDAEKERAFWLDVQTYVDEKLEPPEPDQKHVTLRVPFRNKLTVNAVDRFRAMSLSRMKQLP